MELNELISIVAQIAAYILAVIVFIELVKYLIGGTWVIEDIILGLVVINLTITFGIGGYLIHLSDKISRVDKKVHGHLEWHRGNKK